MGTLRALSIGAVILLLPSCLLLDSDETINVVFPETPPHWEGFSSEMAVILEVVFSDGGGWESDHRFEEGATTLRLPKGRGVALLLHPVYRGIRLPPAGTATPWLQEDGDARPNWYDGVTATILRRLAVGGVGFESFNVARLSDEIKSRTSDPWSLDLDRIVEKIAEGAFRSTYIREERENVLLDLPAGSWISLDPFEGDLFETVAGVNELSLPPLGRNYLTPSGERVLKLGFEPNGTPLFVLRSLK